MSKIIYDLHKNKKIDDNTLLFITKHLNETKLGRFFLLPKIHKIPEETLKEMETNNELRENYVIPGRPIVSLCGTPLHNLSQYIDYILVPLVKKQHTYLRDTKHFIRIIENKEIPNNTYLITADERN